MDTNDLKMPWDNKLAGTIVNSSLSCEDGSISETKLASTDNVKYGDGKPYRKFITGDIKIDANK